MSVVRAQIAATERALAEAAKDAAANPNNKEKAELQLTYAQTLKIQHSKELLLMQRQGPAESAETLAGDGTSGKFPIETPLDLMEFLYQQLLQLGEKRKKPARMLRPETEPLIEA